MLLLRRWIATTWKIMELNHWAETIRAVKTVNPTTTLEVLIPDFDGHEELIDKIIDENQILFRTTWNCSPIDTTNTYKAKYDTSLKVLAILLRKVWKPKQVLCLVLVKRKKKCCNCLLDDALAHGCSIITIGQYMQPSRNNIQVTEYIHPDKFAEYKQIVLHGDSDLLRADHFVRSSYCAEITLNCKFRSK